MGIEQVLHQKLEREQGFNLVKETRKNFPQVRKKGKGQRPVGSRKEGSGVCWLLMPLEQLQESREEVSARYFYADGT